MGSLHVMGFLYDYLSPSSIENLVLVPGGAFRMKFQFDREGEKNRFFFVLNLRPGSDNTLVLATATTKMWRQKDRPKGTVVAIDPAEYSPLTESSLIDCGSCVVKSKEFVVERIASHLVMPLAPLTLPVLERLQKAFATTRTHSPEIKRLVCP